MIPDWLVSLPLRSGRNSEAIADAARGYNYVFQAAITGEHPIMKL